MMHSHHLFSALLALLALLATTTADIVPEIVTANSTLQLEGADVTLRLHQPPAAGLCPATRPIVSLSQLVCDVSSATDGVSKLTTDLSGVSASVSGLAGRAASTETGLSGVLASVSGLAGRIASTETDLSGVSASVSGLAGRVASTETGLSGVSASVSGLTGGLDKIESSFRDLSNKLASLTTKQEVAADVKILGDRITKVTADAVDANANAKKLLDRLDKLEESINDPTAGVKAAAISYYRFDDVANKDVLGGGTAAYPGTRPSVQNGGPGGRYHRRQGGCNGGWKFTIPKRYTAYSVTFLYRENDWTCHRVGDCAGLFWPCQASCPTWGGIFGRGGGGSRQRWYTGSPNSGGQPFSDNSDMKSSWQHIAISCPSSRQCKYYIDGQLKHTTTNAKWGLSPLGTRVHFGNYHSRTGNCNNHFTRGDLDEFAMFGRVLTATEVKAIQTKAISNEALF